MYVLHDMVAFIAARILAFDEDIIWNDTPTHAEAKGQSLNSTLT